jgi:hypothetical protein
MFVKVGLLIRVKLVVAVFVSMELLAIIMVEVAVFVTVEVEPDAVGSPKEFG